MSAQTELEITWDGPIKGLESHRISLSEFGEALTALISAAKRIASNLVSNASEHADRGRLASAAKKIDIEICGVVKGSGGISTLLTFDVPVNAQSEMFNQLAEQVGIELVDSIQAESSGVPRNPAVRKYLQALPANLTYQKYDLHENGREIRKVTFGKMNLPRLISEPLPVFAEIEGRITGVSFGPRWEVKVRAEEGSQMTASATEKQVNDSLEMRFADVHALYVSSGNGNRLVVLENEAPRLERPSLDEIFDKWDATFRALA